MQKSSQWTSSVTELINSLLGYSHTDFLKTSVYISYRRFFECLCLLSIFRVLYMLHYGGWNASRQFGISLLNPALQFTEVNAHTDLVAVPAKTVSEVSCGGALLVHQQQRGKQPLQLQWDDSDLQRYGIFHLYFLCLCQYIRLCD